MKQIKVFADEREVEIFIPQEMLKEYVVGQESLVFTLNPQDAADLAAKLTPHEV